MTIQPPMEVVIYVPTQGASIGYTTEDGPDATVAALHRTDSRRRADDAARQGDPLWIQGERGDEGGVYDGRGVTFRVGGRRSGVGARVGLGARRSLHPNRSLEIRMLFRTPNAERRTPNAEPAEPPTADR